MTDNDINKDATNLYRYIRIKLGKQISDREIGRRWGIPWRSFVLLKQGRRLPPRLDQLQDLAVLLEVPRFVVYEVASGAPASTIAKLTPKQVAARLVR